MAWDRPHNRLSRQIPAFEYLLNLLLPICNATENGIDRFTGTRNRFVLYLGITASSTVWSRTSVVGYADY